MYSAAFSLFWPYLNSAQPVVQNTVEPSPLANFGSGPEMQLLRIVPARRHAQRRVEVLEVEADPLGGEGDLVGRAVDAGVRSSLPAGCPDWPSS